VSTGWLSIARICFSRSLGLAAVAGLTGFLIGTPYALLDLPHFLEGFQTQYGYGNTRRLGQSLEPVPVLYLTSLFQGLGALPVALALAGLALAWRKRRDEAVLCLTFPVIYLAFMLPKARFFPRLEIPLLPFFCLLAGYGTIRLVGLLRPGWRRAGLAALLVAALAQPLVNDLLHQRLLLQTDTRVLANEWVQANLPSRSYLVVESYSLVDLSTPGRTYTPNTAELRIELLRNMSEAQQARYLVERGAHYVVTSSFLQERCLMPHPPDPPSGGFCRNIVRPGLLQRAELLATISPGHGGRELPWQMEDVMTPFWALDQYERPGPTLRIYSLAPLTASAP
jgi:hypothetical protein